MPCHTAGPARPSSDDWFLVRGCVVWSPRVYALALSVLLWLGALVQPPVLPPEPAPPSEAPPSEPPPSEKPPPSEPTGPAPTSLPAGLEPVEFPLDAASQTSEPLQRMEPAPTQHTERRSLVDLRDPFNRPPVRARSQASAHQRLLMPDLKDPFAEGTRRVRSRTLDLRVPGDLRDPFRANKRATCGRTTADGTPIQAPNDPADDCASHDPELHDPFRGEVGKLPPPPPPA